MGAEWVTLRAHLLSDTDFWRFSDAIGRKEAIALRILFKVAALFAVHGDGFGRLPDFDSAKIDKFVHCKGVSAAMLNLGWLRDEDGVLSVHEFCYTESRRPIAASVRAAILDGASCRACAATDYLTIDHNIPLSRGGTDDPENLQPLCSRCNSAKGSKTMDEFMGKREGA